MDLMHLVPQVPIVPAAPPSAARRDVGVCNLSVSASSRDSVNHVPTGSAIMS